MAGNAVRLSGTPFIAAGCAASQRLVFSIGDHPLQETALSAEAPVDLVIPRDLLSDKYLAMLTIDLPDAVSERSCGLGEDRRLRAFGFRSVRVAKTGA